VDNTVFENKSVTGQITVDANNVTIRNCVVNTTDYFGIRIMPGVTGTVIEDCEIYASGNYYTGIAAQDAIIRRVNIHDFENGLAVGSNVLVQDSYIHDLYYSATTHVDGIEWGSSGSNTTIDHNRIVIGGDTGTVNITPYSGGTASNNTVSNNLFSGGTYSLYIRGDGGGTVDGVNVFNNVWVKNSYAYGPYSIVSATNITWSNNKLDDGTVVTYP